MSAAGSSYRGVASIAGCGLAWEEKGAGPPVLFIHGTAASVWGGLFDRVAGSCRALRYDRRGFGRSSHRPIANLSRHADDASALLAERSIGRAVVVGWSIGGVIAAELAVRRPQLVRGLILLEPPLWAKRHPDLNLFDGVVLSIALGLVAGPARGGRRFSRWVFRERDGAGGLDRVDPTVREQVEANAAAVGTEIRGGTGEHLSTGQLAAISVPTKVFAGDRSQKFLADGAQRMASAISGASFTVLEGASHWLQIERPDVIAAAVIALAGDPSTNR